MDAVARWTIVRHGQNVAFADAHARGVAAHGLTGRDVDVELSPLGWRQAARLGHWLAAQSADERPDRVLYSPYLRARQTWAQVVESAGSLGVRCPPAEVDVRLGDRHMGDLELLTPLMIADRYPAEAARLAADGPYAYRPPGGETYDDVAGRVRAVLADLNSHHAGRRVWVVAHDAVLVAVRRVLEGLSFADLDAILATTPVTNTSLTRYTRTRGRLDLVRFAATPHLTTEHHRHGRERHRGATSTARAQRGERASPVDLDQGAACSDAQTPRPSRCHDGRLPVGEGEVAVPAGPGASRSRRARGRSRVRRGRARRASGSWPGSPARSGARFTHPLEAELRAGDEAVVSRLRIGEGVAPHRGEVGPDGVRCTH